MKNIILSLGLFCLLFGVCLGTAFSAQAQNKDNAELLITSQEFSTHASNSNASNCHDNQSCGEIIISKNTVNELSLGGTAYVLTQEVTTFSNKENPPNILAIPPPNPISDSISTIVLRN